MKEVYGNAWDLIKTDYDVLCLTTNGTIKANGECVMGRGIAFEAKQRFPLIPKIVGDVLKKHGNVINMIGNIKLGKSGKSVYIYTFPVKHNWWETADIKLIERSARQLVETANKNDWKKVLLPRPGCGNGHLNWTEVKQMLEPLLDDRFHIVHWEEQHEL